MPDPAHNRPSFSIAHRWKIVTDIAVRTVLVISIVVMANYLGSMFFHRFYLSQQRHGGLSPITLGVLHTLTNHVSITLFYDRNDDFFPDITSLLDEYREKNPDVTYSVIDYNRDPGKAVLVKQKYGLNSSEDKNMFIFDSDGHVKVGYGDQLVQIGPKGMDKDKKLEFGPVAFQAEQLFTAMILSLENPTPLKAYYLQGHGEPSVTDTGNFGYHKFAEVLAQNYIAIVPLELSAGESIPMDCDLLIVARAIGSVSTMSDSEVQAVDRYLTEGGRLLALFNSVELKKPMGLEPVLQHWGVAVPADTVADPRNSQSGQDIRVMKFGKHPLVNSFSKAGSALQMILPRPVINTLGANPPASAPQVTELAFSGPDSTLSADSVDVITTPQSFPLIAAVEQKPVAGTVGVRGSTRILVSGDSIFLGNYYIDGGVNRDFLGYVLNWLMNRMQLLQDIPQRPLTEYRLDMSADQQRHVQWILLAGLPGVVLLLGGMVWFVRRR